MKKIKLKSLIDPTADNIDDIYGNIVEELNLNKKAESNKQINSLLNKAKQNPQSVKKVKDDDLLLLQCLTIRHYEFNSEFLDNIRYLFSISLAENLEV